jgi:hypothetical protein
VITVERRSPRRTFTTQPWCVLDDGKVIAECRSQAAAERIRAALIAAEPSTLQAKIRHAMEQPSTQL